MSVYCVMELAGLDGLNADVMKVYYGMEEIMTPEQLLKKKLLDAEKARQTISELIKLYGIKIKELKENL